MSLPRKSTRNGTRGYAHLVEIDVPVARVWRGLTEPSLIRIWAGQEAETEEKWPDGSIHGRILPFEPPGWSPDLAGSGRNGPSAAT